MWVALALTCAILTAVVDVLTKRATAAQDHRVVALARWGWALPPLLAAQAFAPLPRLTPGFWGLLLLLAPLEIAALLLFVRAVGEDDLSLSVPLLGLTPVLLLAVGWAVLGERPTPAGAAGVGLVALGAYCMHLGDLRHGVLQPLRALARRTGPRLVLLVAAIYAVTSALGKKAVLEAGPVTFALAFYGLLTGLLASLLALQRRPLGHLLSRWRTFAPIGLLYGVAALAQFAAYTLAPVAHAIAVKRTSLVLAVLSGRLVFGEERFAERLVAGVLVLAGVVVIALS